MTRSNSAPQLSEQPVLTLGFCFDLAGEAKLLAAGIPKEMIWRRGDQMACLDHALRYFRQRPGILAVVDDLRIFGESRRAIIAQQHDLKARGILVLDVVTNDNDELSLLDRALKALSSSAGMRNHRTARRRGAKGGEAKGIAAQMRRNARVADDIVERLCSLPQLTWKLCAWVLGEGFSAASLNRHYGEE